MCGGGFSKSTYYENGRSVDGAGNVVDDGVLLCCTMVWIWIFLWLKQHVLVPTQTYGAKETWFRLQPFKATAVAPSIAHQDITINQKIDGKFLASVWGGLQKPPTMAAVGAMGVEETIIH